MQKESISTPARTQSSFDPYRRDSSFYLNPPKNFSGMLRYWGPGIVLTASIVGSGELIATTGLGAKVGFLALWLILLSCFIKVALQLMIGRFVIYSGETTLVAFDKIPGPRARTSWINWLWLMMMIMVSFQQGAMLAGVAMVLNIVFPNLPVTLWALIVALGTIVLLIGGRYGLLEKLSVVLVASFTATTLICVGLLSDTPYTFTSTDLWQGLKLQIPTGGIAIAIAAFGLTGIGTTELIYYPYWCIEKGYARAVGVQEDTDAWFERARGWTRTMNWDALLSMVIYTVVTLAFYVLGASVLHAQNLLPEGMEMVRILSTMYTETLGVGAFYLFLIGAFVALFSTIFSSIAANGRQFTDFFHLIAVIKVDSYAERLKWIRIFVTVQPLLYFALLLFFEAPFWMVVTGGVSQSLMLPAVAYATLYLRYRRLDKKLQPSPVFDILLLLSCLLIVVVAIYGLASRI